MATINKYKVLRPKLVRFMMEKDILDAYHAEVNNIGNEKMQDIYDDLEKGEGVGIMNNIYYFFQDENHIQWDASVSDVAWNEIDAEWKKICDAFEEGLEK